MYAALPICFSCEKDAEFGEFDYRTLEDGIPDDVKYFTNAPYPANADVLRILAIGNSFTDDATLYLNDLVQASGIDMDRCCLYKVMMSSAGFDTWIHQFYSDGLIYPLHVTGNVKMEAPNSFSALLAQPWDVIVIQQVSTMSYQWKSYDCLKEYVELITSTCPNKDVCLAFQLVWSHGAWEMPYVMQGNIACCKKMAQRYGVDVIIPTGTAIQIARGTSLNDQKYMTCDNHHLNKGMACYIASCTWFEKLLTPVFGVSVMGNPARPSGEETDEAVRLGQRCAVYAVGHPYDETYVMSE